MIQNAEFKLYFFQGVAANCPEGYLSCGGIFTLENRTCLMYTFFFIYFLTPQQYNFISINLLVINLKFTDHDKLFV